MYLNCHSFYSLRYGTIPLEELVNLAVKQGVKALALTDINTITGIYDFKKACDQAGIHAVVGVECRANHQLKFIALAQNTNGITEINRFVTHCNLNNIEIPDLAPDFKNVFVIYPLENQPDTLRDFEFLGFKPSQISQCYKYDRAFLSARAVVLQPVTFRNKTEYELHCILRAIDLNTLRSKLQPNDHAHFSEQLVQPARLERYFADYPELVANTYKILQACRFDFEFRTPKNKQNFTESKASDAQLLRKLAYEGLEKRYGAKHEAAQARVEKELKVIDELNFNGYFLITWDIIQFSNSQGFLHIGRGSGANSIVSYCLGITDICPIELDLYFERFLNLNRKTPPDFDIDWSWKERDRILDYIFEKYGPDHVAFCGTNVEFKYRSIIREVGKVYGLPKEELDFLATHPLTVHDKNQVVQLVHEFGTLLEKYPNQRSMHACGILISEEPITNYSILELPPKGFPIVQFDMHIAEDVGFDKFDILSQRGIGHIDDSVKLIAKNQGITVDIRDTRLSKNEPKANESLSRGQTIGCFYIESPAMRGLLRRLKCDNYKTLVAASSIIRPGVAQSGMMKEYIFRHNFPDKFEYFHPVFEQQLGETYGIMVYQEDVIKIALHYGGLPATDGDVLRRAMSGKGRSKAALQKVKDHFFECCAKQGHPLELSKEIYRQIESFAGYSFCKAHSASYAVESYQSLYLKTYFPIEFMVAVINNQGGFYRTEVYVHEARMAGAQIENPCVNNSEIQTTVYGKVVYLGFMHLEGLHAKVAADIVENRTQFGAFQSLENFIERIPIGIENLQILIFIGAFRFTKLSKNELLIRARMILVNFKPEDRNWKLLAEPIKPFKLPDLPRSVFEDAFDEIELLNFPVSCSPFDLLKTKYRGDVLARDLNAYHKKTVRMLAYLVSRKHVPTKLGSMYFGTWIDVEGTFFDTAHFADCLQKYPFQGGGCYLLLGFVEVDYHFPTITIQKMAKMPFIPDPRFSASNSRAYTTQQNMREDVSLTHRKPYPQEHEINLPRQRMKV